MTAQQLRVIIANDIACEDFSFTEALNALEAMKYFDNWEEDELYFRPIDTDQITEVVGDFLGIY